MAEVLLALDDYSEVFSDFDVRDYKVRALSRDFVEELLSRRRITGPIERIVLTLPRRKRIKSKEPLIAKRVKDYFRRKITLLERRKRKNIKDSAMYFLFGLASYVFLINLPPKFEVVYDFALFPSWYLSWIGLDKLRQTFSYDAKIEVYRELVNAEIVFEDEEDYEA